MSFDGLQLRLTLEWVLDARQYDMLSRLVSSFAVKWGCSYTNISHYRLEPIRAFLFLLANEKISSSTSYLSTFSDQSE